ncbi:MAG TPA: hypothetical protein VK358_15385 [Longimicrobium sp.]|nr:hypothetical protein [Longimicrobium sp.]
MKTACWLILPALLLAACDTIVTDEGTPLEPGTYALVSIDGAPLPAPEPCSSVRIEEERITVGAIRDVEYYQRTIRPPANEVRTLGATGSYRTTFDGLVHLNLQLTGDGAPAAFTPVLQRTPRGLTQIVGQPCDGHSVKLYQLRR